MGHPFEGDGPPSDQTAFFEKAEIEKCQMDGKVPGSFPSAQNFSR